jgi:hypothetical protein
VEQGKDPFLQGGTEVDQNVAATDQVQARKGRIADEVLAGEDAHFAQVLLDLEAAARGGEEIAQPGLGQPVDLGLGVEAPAGLLNGLLTGIGAENAPGGRSSFC